MHLQSARCFPVENWTLKNWRSQISSFELGKPVGLREILAKPVFSVSPSDSSGANKLHRVHRVRVLKFWCSESGREFSRGSQWPSGHDAAESRERSDSGSRFWADFGPKVVRVPMSSSFWDIKDDTNMTQRDECINMWCLNAKEWYILLNIW